MATEEAPNDGGGGRGARLILKRSELAILRRYANRYPIVEGERQEAVDTVMEAMRDKEAGPRARIAAVKALTAMDRLNLTEMATYIQAKTAMKDELKPASQVDVNVSIQVAVIEAGKKLEASQVQRAQPITNGHGNGKH